MIPFVVDVKTELERVSGQTSTEDETDTTKKDKTTVSASATDGV